MRLYITNVFIKLNSGQSLSCGLRRLQLSCVSYITDSFIRIGVTRNMTSKSGEIIIDKRPFTAVTEGKATVDFPSSLDVFYNPVQEFNRDLSVAVLRLFASNFNKVKGAKLSQSRSKSPDDDSLIPRKHLKLKEEDFKGGSLSTALISVDEPTENQGGIRILEALAASGLRSIRYAREVGGVEEIVANDYSIAAVECMKTNIERNKVEQIVKPSHSDASMLMYQCRSLEKRFDVIDLDPYGSPHCFLDAAVQSVADGGLLIVTCTDMAVLCGNSPETCYIKYGALSMKHKACHEMALRIILQCIESNANKYGRYIVPLISLSADFYCRVFVQVFTSQLKCKESFSKLSWIHHCPRCYSTSLDKLGLVVRNGSSIKYQLGSPSVGPDCKHCGGTYQTGGPIWTAPIHNQEFISCLRISLANGSSVNTIRRIEGVLSMMEEELPDIPLYYVFDQLLKVLRLSSFKRKEFVSAILNAGWRVSPTHAHKDGIKTDAPAELIWDILRTRERLSPVNIDVLPLSHPARFILRGRLKEDSIATSEERVLPEINFSLHPDAESRSEKQKLLRFQINPEKNWGPKMRSVTSLFHEDLQDKSMMKQGKRKRNGDNENGSNKNGTTDDKNVKKSFIKDEK